MASARQLVVKFAGQVEPTLGKSIDKVSGALGKTDKESKTLGQSIRTGLKVAAVAAAGAAIKLGKDSVKAFKSAAGEVIPLSRNLGMSAVEASHLRFQMKASGVDVEAGAKGLLIFAKNVTKMSQADAASKRASAIKAEGLRVQIAALEKAKGSTKGYTDKMASLKEKLLAASAGSKLNASAMGELGVKYTDARGKLLPMAQLLPKVADRFASMPDGAQKTAMAMKLFGKSGAGLLPFLNKGASGLAELSAKSDLYGQTLSGANLQALKDSKGAQRDWSLAVEGFKIQFGAQLLPMLTDGVKFFTSSLIPSLVGVTGFLRDNGDAVKVVLSVGGGLVGLITTISKVSKAWAVVQGVLNVALSANPIGIVVIALGALVAGLVWAYNNCADFRAGCDTAFKAIGDAGRWLWNNALMPAMKAIVGGFAWVTGGLARMLDALGNIPGFEWAKRAAAGLQNMSTAALKAASSMGAIPNPKVNTGKSQAEVKRLDSRIRALKGKVVKAQAKGDTKEVDRLKKRIADLRGKKVTLEANVKKTGPSTIAMKIVSKGTVKFSAYANGGIRDAVKRFANGGVENHVAQIARAGDYRLWAEEETGGESYIPLARAKRGRSVPIWWETGRRLGIVPFADGGITRRQPGRGEDDPLLAAILKLADRVLTVDDLQLLLNVLRQAAPGPRPAVRLG